MFNNAISVESSKERKKERKKEGKKERKKGKQPLTYIYLSLSCLPIHHRMKSDF